MEGRAAILQRVPHRTAIAKHPGDAGVKVSVIPRLVRIIQDGPGAKQQQIGDKESRRNPQIEFDGAFGSGRTWQATNCRLLACFRSTNSPLTLQQPRACATFSLWMKAAPSVSACAPIGTNAPGKTRTITWP